MDRTAKIKMKDSAASRSETEASGNLHFINLGEMSDYLLGLTPKIFALQGL
jgi:hypothetical protein